MRFREIVVEKAVIPKLASSKRDEAIAELVDALVAAKTIAKKERDEFLKAVIAREKRGSTGFGHGVAVPHVKSPTVERLAVAIGISPDGVDFNALDRQPVHAIVLMLSPESKPEDHLAAMEVIFGALSQDRFRKFLRQARSVSDITTLLEEADAAAPVR